ncbi:MAG: FAD:protein FMN transferase [Chloroflexi bacterium]|nr:FAD:protein FMN transferase [Chloroflexota bacterium]
MENSIDRRKFIRISAISAAVLGGGALLGKTVFDTVAKAKEYSEVRSMIGTRIEIKVVDVSKSAAKSSVDIVFKEMSRLARVFSRFDPASELATLNSQGYINNASGELVEILNQSKDFGDLTEGVFDVSILPVVTMMETYFAAERVKKAQNKDYVIIPPSDENFATALSLVNYQDIIIDGHSVSFAKAGMQVTLDGVAKGYIVQKAVDKLEELGYQNMLVNGGGDIATRGYNEDYEQWKIGITHPRAMAGYYAIATINSGCIATSGDYEVPNAYTSDNAYHHIINPKTATWSDLASASVWAPQSATADALATACMALGSKQGLALIDSIDGAQCLLIKKDLSRIISNDFPYSEII